MALFSLRIGPMRKFRIRFLKTFALMSLVAGGAIAQVTLSGSLPDGTEAASYSGQITASGGVTPYHFSLALGSFLPVSLQLADNGAISGTLNTFGTFSFFVQVSDSSVPAQTGTQQFSLIVHQMASTPLVFASTTLPIGVFGAPYSAQAQVSGGIPPYQIVATQNELPLTFSFNFGQFVTDSLAVPPGTYQFHVSAQDSTVPPQMIQSLFTFTVLPGISVSGVFEGATALQPYSGHVSVSSGTPPYTFALTSGALPPGLQLDGGTGIVTGTPAHPGNFTFGIGVTDSVGLTGSGTFTIAVAGLPLSLILPSPVPAGQVGVVYPPLTMAISGGVPPYTFAFVNLGGGPPPGLTFNLATGVLSGTPTVGGNFGFEFEAIDQIGDTGFYNFLGTVLDIQPSTLPNGSPGTAYQVSFGGIGFPTNEVTFSLFSGTPPTGLSIMPFGANGQFALRGVPTVLGTFNFTVKATDGGQYTVFRSYSVTIAPPVGPPLSFGPLTLPSGTLGQPYSQSFNTSNSTPPVTFVQTPDTGGSLPPGLTLTSAGTVTGTPTHLGTYGFDVTAADSTGKTVTAPVYLSILSPPLTVMPTTIPSGTVGQNYSVTFVGSGGLAPYSYSLELQPVPGLFLDPSTGILSGKPTSGGTYNIEVEVEDLGAGMGFQKYTLTIAGATQGFVISPSTLNDGIVGHYYNQNIGAQGAALPVQWTISSGALPPGLNANPTGEGSFLAFTGVLNTAGTYPFQITGTDANGQIATASFTVHATDQIIRVSPNTVPSGLAGMPYSVSFSASGGTPPYSFVALNSAGGGFSPDGLLMSSTGTLSGIPLASSLSLFRVQATDSTGLTGSWDYQFSFVAGTLSVSPVSLPFGKIRTFYTAGMTASLGTPPYTYAVASGTLPNGLGMNSAGILSGTPLQAGIFQFVVTANDSAGAFGTVNCQLNIVGDTITLGPNVLPDAIANQPYSAQITASGGTGPYILTMPSATLWSSAMNFAPNGTISGTAPSSVVTLSFTIQATDANGSTGSQVFQINVGASGLILLPGTLTSAIVGAPYSVTFATSGGQAPYSFSLGAGSILPAGMTLSNGGLFSGTPTSSGTFRFTVQAHDANSVTGTLAYALTVLGLNVSIGTTSIPAGQQGIPYTAILQASGGMGPYTWTVTQGSPPNGLSLSVGGVLTGTPTVIGGFQFTVIATDQIGQTASQALLLTINTATPSISSVSPNPVPGLNANQAFFINGSGFQNGSGLTVRLAEPTGQTDLQGSQVNFLSSSQLSIVINTGTSTANWTVQVINPNGQISNIFSFAIAAQSTTTSFALPQFVFGGSWYTALYFANTTNSPVTFTANFIADDGSPLSVPLAGVGTVSSQSINLNASSTVMLEALNDSGSSVEGWVEASLPAGVVGYAVFRQVVSGRANQEAVVPLTTESSQTADLIYDDIAFTTSVAFLNPSNQPATVTIFVYGSDGSPLGSTQVVVAPRSKQATVLKALAGLEALAGNRGRAVFSVSSGAVSVLGLRFGGSAFTSIPVTERTGALNESPISLALPQFVFGGAWYTALYFANTTNSPVSFPVNFIGDDATPLSAPLLGIGNVTSQTVNLAPGATVILEAPADTGSSSEGWVDTSLPPGVVGYAVFRQTVPGRADQEAVVPLTPESNQAADLVYDDIQFTTSVAFLNPSDQQVTVTISTFTASGVPNGSTQVMLLPRSKQAVELKNLPGLESIAGNRGWAAFSVSNGAVSVLGLRFGGQAFTSIPAPGR